MVLIYSSEMPTDRATQMSLGLNHGLPAWYRRTMGYSMNQPSVSPPNSITTVSPQGNQRQLDGNWRRLEGAPGVNSNGGNFSSFQQANGKTFLTFYILIALN